MLPLPRRFHALPDIQSGAPLSHFVGVIVPEATTNLVTNPSIETATTNYTAVGGSIARSATKQYHGTYSLAITPTSATTDGAYYGTISLTSGTTYTLSCKFWGVAGVKYKISFATTGGVDLAVKAFIGTGRWQWLWVTYSETSTTTRRLYFTKNTHTSTGVFYVDGVQVEALAYPTTYCDGDEEGLLIGQQPPPYAWTGTPHASTSTRSALTRAGGRVINIRTAYGFLLTGLIGLGMVTPNNISIPYTVLDGARYQRTQKPPRTFSLVGRFQAATRAHLDRLRGDMRAVLDRDYVPIQQPLALFIEPRDDCGEVAGDFATVPCVYAGGLEGNDTSALAEDAAPAFVSYLPYIVGGDGGASLTVQLSVSNANGILQRSAAGVWSAVGTGVSGGTGVYAFARGLDGSIYVGGAFTAMGGVANTSRIARWDGSAWNAMGTGAANQNVSDLAVAPDGSIYAVGTFTAMGGVANTKMIARWNGSAWVAVGTGGDAGTTQLLAIAIASNGDVYVAGTMTSIGGVAAAGIAKWNGSAWSALSTGLTGGSAVGGELVFDAAGRLYVGGGFTTAGGVAATNIARWNGSAFTALGSGLGVAGTQGVRSMAFDAGGRLYAGGAFTVSGSVTINRIGMWNGSSWQPLGTGTNNDVYGISFAADGMLFATGTFTTANGITTPDAAARWNGSTWLPLDADFPGTLLVYTAKTLTDKTSYFGFESNGTATTAATTVVTNTTPGIVFPRLVINGPSSGTSRIYQIVNYTTGIGIWLNLTLNAGEVATLVFDPQNASYTTTFQGDITNLILPGSQPALMYLAPGANNISFFSASSTVTATLRWQNHYNGLADLVQ